MEDCQWLAIAYPAAWKKIYQRQLADLGIGRLGFVTNFFYKVVYTFISSMVY